MAARHYTLTLNGAAQRLSTVLGNTEVGGPQDEAFRMISFQAGKANTNDIFIGATSSVSSSDYGVRLDPTDTQPNDILGHFDTGPYKLSDFYVIGTNAEKLHILAIPF